jgi:membrane protein DedA with SNARE-associated domain/rhodanese-related sulfurtransferase
VKLETVLHLITQYGLVVVFVCILAEQLGVPFPGFGLLVITGALAARGQLSVFGLLAVAVLACLMADHVWYAIGRRSGRKVLKLLCKISLSPDSCVRQTESIFTRFGPPSLTVAKFIPGFASMATALAGAMRIAPMAFLIFDFIGSALWASAGLGLGWLFSSAIDDILATLGELGRWGLMLLVGAIALYVANKWWQRYRFNRQLRMDRVSVESLVGLIDSGRQPVIVDVRSDAARGEGRIPGAIPSTGDALPAALLAHPKDGMVVVYCACPNDASAVAAARKLLEKGFRNVRPLAGGVDAWVAAGRGLET